MPNVILPYGVPVRVAGCFEAQLQHFENSEHKVHYNKTGVISPRFGNISEWFKFYNRHVQIRQDIVYFLNTSSAENAVLAIEGADKPNDCGFHVDQQLPDGTYPALPAIDFPTDKPPVKAPILQPIPDGTVGHDAAVQTFSPLVGAVDPEGGAMSVTSVSVSPTTAGTATVVGDDIKFTPNPDFTGVALVSYVVTSTSGAKTSGSAKFTITANKAVIITPIPEKAILSSASKQIIDVLAFSTDPEGQTVTIEPALTVSPAGGGTAIINAGKVEFTPAHPFEGPVVIGYAVKDDMGKVTNGSFTYNVTKDQPVVASNTSATVYPTETIRPLIVTSGQDPEGKDVAITDIDLNGFLGTVIVDPASTSRLKVTPDGANTFGDHVIKFMLSDGANKTPSTLTVTYKKRDITPESPVSLKFQNNTASSKVISLSDLIDENPDNQSVTLALTGLPPEFTYTVDNTAHTITVTSSATATYHGFGDGIKTVMTDENGKVYSRPLELRVNHAPTIKTAQPEVTIAYNLDNKVVDVVANLEDFDGDAVILDSITSITPNTVTAIIVNGKIKVSRKSDAATTSTVTFKVKDNKGGFLTATLDVVVEKAASFKLSGTAIAGTTIRFESDAPLLISPNNDGVYTEYPAGLTPSLSTTGSFSIKSRGTVTAFKSINNTDTLTMNIEKADDLTDMTDFMIGGGHLTEFKVSSPAVTSKVTNMHSAFNGCRELTSFPLVDTSKVTDMAYTWINATKLKCLPALDLTSCTYNVDMLTNTPALVHPVGAEVPAKGASWTNTEDCPVTFEVSGTVVTGGDEVEVMAKCSLSISANNDGVYVEYADNAGGHTVSFTSTGAFHIKGKNVTAFKFSKGTKLKTVHIEKMDDVTDLSSFLKYARKVTTVTVSNPDVTKNVTNMSSLFYGCKALVSSPFMNTSSVTSMRDMYKQCETLLSAPLLDTSKVTDMHNMYNYCRDLTTLPLLDTSKVTDASAMYYGCNSATSFPLIDTGSVINAQNMYTDCKVSTSFPLINTSNATNTSGMYKGCKAAAAFPLINTSKVIITTGMYSDCTGATSFPLIDTSSSTDTSNMYSHCTSATSFPLIDTGNAVSTGYMYTKCTSATTFPLIDTSKVTDASAMYYGCTSATSFPLIDTSSLTTTLFMYRSCSAAKTFPAIDTSKVTSMYKTYAGCTALECLSKLDLTSCTSQTGMLADTPNRVAPTDAEIPANGNVWTNTGDCPDLSTFDVSGTVVASGDTVEVVAKCSLSISANNDGNYVEYADSGAGHTVSFTSTGAFHIKGKNVTAFKFSNGTRLNTVHIEKMDDVTDMTNFLRDALLLKNITVSSPDVTKNVTKMTAAFWTCRNLTSLPMLNTSMVTDMSWMLGRTTFSTYPLFDTKNVQDFSGHYFECTNATSFPALDTSSCTITSSMYQGCTAATSFPVIDTSKVLKCSGMYTKSDKATSFPLIDTSKATTMSDMYSQCTALICLPKLDLTSCTNHNDILALTPNRTAPTDAEIPANGNVWVNPDAC